MVWPKRRFKPNYPPGQELIAGHIYGYGLVFKGSEDAIRLGFQTVDQAASEPVGLAVTNAGPPQ
jgi:hypothetical protein